MDDSEARYAKISAYVDAHPAAVLSTIDENGHPYGATIFVSNASGRMLCFVTKAGTEKFKNLTAHPMVSLTFFSERDNSTLQVSGVTQVVEDKSIAEYVLDSMQKKHAMQASWAAPVTKVNAGDIVVIGLTVKNAKLTEYQTAEADMFGGLAITEFSES